MQSECTDYAMTENLKGQILLFGFSWLFED